MTVIFYHFPCYWLITLNKFDEVAKFSISLIPESVRWLRLNGRIEEAEEILRKVARRNKQPWPNAKLSAPTKTVETVSAKYLFVPTKMCISTLIQVFAW